MNDANPYPGDSLLGAGASITTLPMDDLEKADARRRLERRGTFGFARVLDGAENAAQRDRVDDDRRRRQQAQER